MHGVLELTAPMLPPEAPKHLLGIGEPDDLVAGIGLGIDVFDCAVPTRLARHGMALAPLPASRFRFDVARSGFADDEGPLVEGCPCPTCARHTRAYLHYLVRAEELTAGRLLTLHNLTFLERLVAGAREARPLCRVSGGGDDGRASVGGIGVRPRTPGRGSSEVRGVAADKVFGRERRTWREIFTACSPR